MTRAAAGGLGFFISFVPYFFVASFESDLSTFTSTEKFLACVSSTTCAGLGINIFTRFEINGAALDFSNMDAEPTDGDDFTLAKVLLMLLVDTAGYFAVAWYVEQVFPGKFGVPEPFYFPLKPSYWFPRWCACRYSEHAPDPPDKADPAKFEEEPVGPEAGIQLMGLRKEFRANGASNVAVNDVWLNMYQGQVRLVATNPFL